MEECLFCKWKDEKEKIILENEYAFARFDEFPVNKGHILFMTKRHNPDGYNIGMNCGKAAGQSVMHIHVHLIPRYEGDVEDPRGGVRGVVPKNQNY